MLILCFSWSKYIYLAVISEQVCKITNKFSNGKERIELFSCLKIFSLQNIWGFWNISAKKNWGFWNISTKKIWGFWNNCLILHPEQALIYLI